MCAIATSDAQGGVAPWASSIQSSSNSYSQPNSENHPLSRPRGGTLLAGSSSLELGCEKKMPQYTALREEDGRTYIVPIQDTELKIKGLGRFAPKSLLEGTSNGERVTIGQKVLTRGEVGLPELRKGMRRRAQIINPKDAGFLIAWMGIGSGQSVLEAGHGSGGLALHLANVL